MNLGYLTSILMLFHFSYSQYLSASEETMNLERLSFTDDSYLLGNFLELTKDKKLYWKHPSSGKPLEFDFNAVESITLNRPSFEKEQIESQDQKMEIHLSNGDYLIGAMQSMDYENLFFSSGFRKNLKLQFDSLSHLYFLPGTHQVLFDAFTDYKSWKKSNSKSWREEQGDLLSIFSGSTGTTLPKIDALNMRFRAEWERSFYLAIRFFSDSDGGNYGDVGYHLSFSNNRINLQSNKNLSGRTIRETLGSQLVDDLSGVKSAQFEIFANRLNKQFVIKINGKECARWHDPNKEYIPKENGILLINQGGNSIIRLKEISLTGWEGEFMPHPVNSENSSHASIIFKNGDSSRIMEFNSTEEHINFNSPFGNFSAPLDRVQRLNFKESHFESVEHFKSGTHPVVEPVEVLLKKAKGKIKLELNEIKNGFLHGRHPSMGDLKIPLEVIRKIEGGISLKKTEEFLNLLNQAQNALEENNPQKALSILQRIKERRPCWKWRRMVMLCKNLISEEILSFDPYPDQGLAKIKWIDEKDQFLGLSKNGIMSKFKGQKEIFHLNLGYSNWSSIYRKKNEGIRMISITRPFWLGKNEVTYGEFERLMGKQSEDKNSLDLPISVSWQDAVEFCTQLNQRFPPPSGYLWRLPTEAEWEYACKAGSDQPDYFSNDTSIESKDQKYHGHLNSIAWYQKNSGGEVQKIGKKKKNAWGLYDMIGNLPEWCMDSVSPYKLSFLIDRKPGISDPLSSTGSWRAVRGGSYQSKFDQCRSSFRDAKAIDSPSSFSGFRVALAPKLKREINHSEYSKEELERKISDSNISLGAIDPGTFIMGSPDQEYAPGISMDKLGENIYFSNHEGQILEYDLTENRSKVLFETNSSVLKLLISKDGKFLVAGSKCGECTFYNLKNNQIQEVFNDHSGPILSFSLDQRTNFFASCGLDGTVVLRDIQNGKIKWKLLAKDYPNFIDHLEFSGDSQYLLTSGHYSSVLLLKVENGEVSKIADPENLLAIKAHWSINGRFIYILHPGGAISQVIASSEQPYRKLNFPIGDAKDFEISKCGKLILLISENGKCQVSSLPVDDSIMMIHPNQKIEKSPDFSFKAKSDKENPSAQNLSQFISKYVNTEKEGSTGGIAHSSDGKWTATTLDGSLKIWSQRTGKFFEKLNDSLISSFSSCAFSRDAAFLSAKLKTGHVIIYPSETMDRFDFHKIKNNYPNWFKPTDQ